MLKMCFIYPLLLLHVVFVWLLQPTMLSLFFAIPAALHHHYTLLHLYPLPVVSSNEASPGAATTAAATAW